MTYYLEPQTEDLGHQDSDNLRNKLANANAHRLQKKALIGEIERTLGFSLHDAATGLTIR
jgi:hypothetical protein